MLEAEHGDVHSNSSASAEATSQQHGRTRPQRRRLVHGRERRKRIPSRRVGIVGGPELQRCERQPRGGGMNGNRNRRSARIPPDARRNDREHLGHWRIGITALAHRRAPAESQKASPALADEVGEHAKLLARKERRLHAAKYDGAILKQLLARGWKATDQLQTVSHAQ